MKIAILDDHSMLFSQGISKITQVMGLNNLIINEQDLDELEAQVDLIILDVSLDFEKSIKVIQLIKGTRYYKMNRPKILAFSSINVKESEIESMIKQDVKGLLVKNISISAFSKCIQMVRNGEVYIHPKLSSVLVSSYKDIFTRKQIKCSVDENEYHTPLPLSERELEVLSLIVDGQTYQEIGKVLHITDKTVRNHVYNMHQKTKTKNTIQLVVLAIKNQWVKPTVQLQ